jgi:hypothetical protein
MAHEMIEEGKLLKMIHSVLHDSLLASATGNSATTSDNSTAISRTTTDIQYFTTLTDPAAHQDLRKWEAADDNRSFTQKVFSNCILHGFREWFEICVRSYQVPCGIVTR